jgi:hypothetical protein
MKAVVRRRERLICKVGERFDLPAKDLPAAFVPQARILKLIPFSILIMLIAAFRFHDVFGGEFCELF